MTTRTTVPASPQTANLPKLIRETQDVIRKARKFRHSLNGTGFYANKFAEGAATCTLEFKRISRQLSGSNNSEVNNTLTQISNDLHIFWDPKTPKIGRNQAAKNILFAYNTVIEPALAVKPIHLPSDELFPQEILRGTRGYLESVGRQACGCYDQGWYDAAAVMCRRLLETLIIETYEAHGISDKIKKTDGSFFYLSDLVDALLTETAWNIGRNVRKALPLLKDIGNLSAHNRRYNAKRPDFDKIQIGLRLSIEELIHLAKLK